MNFNQVKPVLSFSYLTILYFLLMYKVQVYKRSKYVTIKKATKLRLVVFYIANVEVWVFLWYTYCDLPIPIIRVLP